MFCDICNIFDAVGVSGRNQRNGWRPRHHVVDQCGKNALRPSHTDAGSRDLPRQPHRQPSSSAESQPVSPFALLTAIVKRSPTDAVKVKYYD